MKHSLREALGVLGFDEADETGAMGIAKVIDPKRVATLAYDMYRGMTVHDAAGLDDSVDQAAEDALIAQGVDPEDAIEMAADATPEYEVQRIEAMRKWAKERGWTHVHDPEGTEHPEPIEEFLSGWASDFGL